MSSGPSLDVFGIGNAIVDVITRTDDAFLARHGLAKGGMTLIDEAQAASLYADMGSAIEVSGGSAANTIAGVASLGGAAAYVGKVRDDQLGEVFRHDLGALGVRVGGAPARSGPPTARSFVLVTPDAQRTMATYLGVSTTLAADEVPEALVADARVTYLEGYLFDPPEAKAAFARAADIARAASRKVAITLSDAFCVHRHRADFLAFIDAKVDLLFANESEAKALFETDDLNATLPLLASIVPAAAVTRSEKGSLVLADGTWIAVPAAPVATVVDTTGAGDLYAAGFLYGVTHAREPAACARLGSLCAAEIISHLGARPETSLAALARQAGLL